MQHLVLVLVQYVSVVTVLEYCTPISRCATLCSSQSSDWMRVPDVTFEHPCPNSNLIRFSRCTATIFRIGLTYGIEFHSMRCNCVTANFTQLMTTIDICNYYLFLIAGHTHSWGKGYPEFLTPCYSKKHVCECQYRNYTRTTVLYSLLSFSIRLKSKTSLVFAVHSISGAPDATLFCRCKRSRKQAAAARRRARERCGSRTGTWGRCTRCARPRTRSCGACSQR